MTPWDLLDGPKEQVVQDLSRFALENDSADGDLAQEWAQAISWMTSADYEQWLKGEE